MTCETCKFWDRKNKMKFHDGTMAQCSQLKEKVSVFPMSASTGWLATASDFSCSLHEPRGNK